MLCVCRNPTPASDSIVKTEWKPIDGHQEFLDIDTELIADTYPFKERMDFWKRLDDQYNSFDINGR